MLVASLELSKHKSATTHEYLSDILLRKASRGVLHSSDLRARMSDLASAQGNLQQLEVCGWSWNGIQARGSMLLSVPDKLPRPAYLALQTAVQSGSVDQANKLLSKLKAGNA